MNVSPIVTLGTTGAIPVTPALEPAGGQLPVARSGGCAIVAAPGPVGSAPPREAPLRITHVVGTDSFAGLERYVVEVSNELAGRGHDLSVVGGSPEAMRRLLSPGIRWAPGGSFTDALRSLTRGGRRDVVHSHISKADFAAVAAAPVTGGRRFATRHLTAPRGYGRAAQLLSPVVRRALTTEIAVSDFVLRAVQPHSDVVLLNGVQRQPDVTAAREKVVLMAHRLAPEKDTSTGLRAWATSGLGDQGWQLVVAGRGDERAALEAAATDLGITASTRFVGWLDEPAETFRTSAVLLAPAPGEPCSLTILEAMAQGLPVVAADSGGNPETVGSADDAALFPPGDAAAAAAHLQRLAADGELRTRYGDELRDLQRREFDLTVHVDRLLGVYAGRSPAAG